MIEYCSRTRSKFKEYEHSRSGPPERRRTIHLVARRLVHVQGHRRGTLRYRVDGVSAEWAAAAHSPAGGRVVVGAGWRVFSIARRADPDGRPRGVRAHSQRDAAHLQKYRQDTGTDDRTA